MSWDSTEAYCYLYQCFVSTVRRSAKAPFERKLIANLRRDLQKVHNTRFEEAVRSTITDLRSTLESEGLHLPGFEPSRLVARARSLSFERVAAELLSPSARDTAALNEIVPDPGGVDVWLHNLKDRFARVQVPLFVPFLLKDDGDRQQSCSSRACAECLRTRCWPPSMPAI